MVQTTAPIIIIGNGRSGSSLLGNVFGAHPEIVMFGEFRFAVAQTWQALSAIFQNASGYRLLDYLDANPAESEEMAESPSLIHQFSAQLEPDAVARRGGIIRRAIEEALYLSERPQAWWGYKEIFNAGEADWSIYDAVFPAARWVHIVRNPVEFVRSSVWHTRQQLTDDGITQHLQSWTAVFQTSRRRSETGRYYEVRYEALIADPEAALTPILEALQIGWNKNCAQAVRQQVGARSERFEMPDHLPSLITQVAELAGIMEELGYAPEARPGRLSRREFHLPRLARTEQDQMRLCGQIWPEEGLAWQFDLDQTQLGGELAAISDDMDLWTRSPLRLFEDGRPLGPAHALHRLIRTRGNGAYSHWQARLIFSTSDNTDPNTNGRVYSFDLAGLKY